MPITIKVAQNGPYIIEGDIQDVKIVDHEGNPIINPGKLLKLCRCGGSTRKPFCDGTHSRIGFRGAEEAVKKEEGAQ